MWFMMACAFVFLAVTYCYSSWKSTRQVGEAMHAVARKPLSPPHKALCKLHPRDVTRKILSGDVGKLSLSKKHHLMNLVWQKRIQQLLEERWILFKNSICLDCSQGVGRPRAGALWNQAVSHFPKSHFLDKQSMYWSAASQGFQKLFDHTSWTLLTSQTRSPPMSRLVLDSLQLAGQLFSKIVWKSGLGAYKSTCIWSIPILQ